MHPVPTAVVCLVSAAAVDLTDQVPSAVQIAVPRHHVLFDLGALGISADLHVRVSSMYLSRSESGRAVEQLDGRSLARPRRGFDPVAAEYVRWHDREVFKVRGRSAA